MNFQQVIDKVTNGEHLNLDQMITAANFVFDDTTDAELIKAFLIALSNKGETADEVAGLASVMKANAVPLDVPEGIYIDNCGTGGDGLKTFNISTTSAFVLAGAGLKVAKHGNRKISSEAGSSDVLQALGIGFIETSEQTSDLLNEHSIAFLHAPNFHPKLKRIGAIRLEIGKPTIFNLVGPLTNPIPLNTQFVGISRPHFTTEYAEVLHLLGRNRAVIVSGESGLDEASLAGENTIVLLDHGDILPFKLRARDVGLMEAPIEAIRGGDAEANAEILKQVLMGEPSAYLDTVLLNAGIALFAYGAAETITGGIEIARQSITSGKAMEKLKQLILYSQKVGA